MKAYNPAYIKYKSSPIQLTEEGEKFISDNWSIMSNSELASHLGISLDSMRVILHGKRMLRMELEYWTEEQVEYLKDNYDKIGDKELAEIFNERFPKKKTWTIKHIEKKRKYLQLKRTTIQLQEIKRRNVGKGRWKNMPTWETRGAAIEGEIRTWYSSKNIPFKIIKQGGKFVHYIPYLWEKHNGKIPEGFIVTTIDGNNLNTVPKNLRLITRTQAAIEMVDKCSGRLTENYIVGILAKGNPKLRDQIRTDSQLLNIKRQQILINREIKKLQHDS